MQSEIAFIENKGQVLDENGNSNTNVLFYSSSDNAMVYITKSGLSYLLIERRKSEEKKEEGNFRKKTFACNRVDVTFLEAKIKAENIIAEDPIITTYNYYHADKVIQNASSYRKVTIKQIYPGIDWVIYSHDAYIKYDFIVHPNADPAHIKLLYEGGESHDIKENKSITVNTSLGSLNEGELYCYQGNNDVVISSSYVVDKIYDNATHSKTQLSIKLGNYDKNKILVIDPVMKWSTYFGGITSTDGALDIAVDKNSGAKYVVGYTFGGIDLPLQNDPVAYNQSITGNMAAFISKFNKDGILAWSTFFGGNGLIDKAHTVTIDKNGTVYVGGQTNSSDFPRLDPAGGAYFQPTNTSAEAFLSAFDNRGALIWSTYYGGSGAADIINDVTTDNNGNIYVTGTTNSPNCVTANPAGGAFYQSTFTPGAVGNMFVLKFSAINYAMLWGTYYGGDIYDQGRAIAVDGSGNIYVSGATDNTAFPLLDPGNGAYYQPAFGGGLYDGFLVKFAPNGAVVWSTYLGGNQDDVQCNTYQGLLSSIAIDAYDNVYVSGFTASTNFPTANPLGAAFYSSTYFGGTMIDQGDVFISKFDKNGALKWGTYYGGAKNDFAYDIVYDGYDKIYVTGSTRSGNFQRQNPGLPSFYQHAYGGHAAMGFGSTLGSGDVFIAAFDTTGVRFWSTFMGGNSDDWATGAAVDALGCLYLTGEFESSSGITTVNPGNGAFYQSSFQGGLDDAFVLKFCPVCSDPTVSITASTDSICPGDSVLLSFSGATHYSWLPSTGAGISTVTSAYVNPASQTTYSLTGYVYGECADTAYVDIAVRPGPVLTITGNMDICRGGTTVLSVSGAVNYLWSNASTAVSITVSPTSATTYSVVGDNGSAACIDTMYATITVNVPPVLSVTSDTSVCAGNAITLSAAGAFNYLWNNGSTTSSVSIVPTSTTTYSVVGDNSNVFCADSAFVTVVVNPSPSINISGDTILCLGTSVTLTTTGGVNYLWSNGSTNQTISVAPTSITNYTVIGTDALGCSGVFEYTIDVLPAPLAVASPNDTICIGESIMLSASGGLDYSWNTGINTSTMMVTPLLSTLYTVTVSTGSCDDSASVYIVVNPLPVVVVSSDTTLIAGSNTVLLASGGTSYSWYPSTGISCNTCSSPLATPVATTIYYVIITDENGCSVLDSVKVIVNDELCRNNNLFIPNAFSPNGDGQNDLFFIQGDCLSEFLLTIYDRWGEKIVELKNISDTWNGTYRGKEMQTGVYFYYFTGMFENKESLSLSGNISLIR